MNKPYFNGIDCPSQFVLALKDAQNAINGKWKLAIVSTMLESKKRFSDVQRFIPQITPRMLSKELKELEINGVVKRTVIDSFPVTIEYQLTPSGKRLGVVLNNMVEWGLAHRSELRSDRAAEQGNSKRQSSLTAEIKLGLQQTG